MHVTVTIRMQAQSQGELIDTFGAQVQVARDHFEALKQEGVFGEPANTDLRYLIIGGGWRAEPVDAEQLHGTPEV